MLGQEACQNGWKLRSHLDNQKQLFFKQKLKKINEMYSVSSVTDINFLHTCTVSLAENYARKNTFWNIFVLHTMLKISEKVADYLEICSNRFLSNDKTVICLLLHYTYIFREHMICDCAWNVKDSQTLKNMSFLVSDFCPRTFFCLHFVCCLFTMI